MIFYELDTENQHGCWFCQNNHLDIGEYGNRRDFVCDITKEIINGVDYYRPNDCKKYTTILQNDYRKRYDLERELKKMSDALKKSKCVQLSMF